MHISHKLLWIFLGIVVILIVTVSIYNLYLKPEGPLVQPPDSLFEDTYRNNEYGFEVNYPKGWVVDDSGSDESLVSLHPELAPGRALEGVGFKIYYWATFPDVGIINSVDELREAVEKRYSKDNPNIKVGKIGGFDIVKIEGLPGYVDSESEVFVLLENGGGLLSFYPGNWVDSIKKIAIDTAGTSNWKTYRNEKYGFEVKYPLDFKEQKAGSDTTLLNITKTEGGDSFYFGISIKKNYKVNQIVSSVKEVTKINVENYLGYKYFYIEGAGTSGVALIQIGQDALSINFDLIGNVGNGQNFSTANDRKIYVQNFLNQILSTFKFINNQKDLITDETVIKGDFTGYYTQYEKDLRGEESWGGEGVCDAFVVVSGDESLTKYFLDMITSGNTVQHTNEQGQLVLNLNIRGVNQNVVETIKSSKRDKPITLTLEKKLQGGTEAPLCSSFFKFIGIKP